MKPVHLVFARFSALLLVLLFSSTVFAGSPKVEVCHVPPGNADNFHTIKISEKALGKHLGHGDLAGPCDAVCEQLCDDGNACTIDYDGDCEANGCYVVTQPVDCSDKDILGNDNLCTDDICDPISGCSNPVSVTCEPEDPSNECVTSVCDPVFGVCEETTLTCNEGETCNPENGMCETDEPSSTACPCFILEDLQSIGTVQACGNNTFPGFPNMAGAVYTNGNLACSGDGCTDFGVLSCSINIGGNIDPVSSISGEEDAACRALILENCISSSAQEASSPTYQSPSEGEPFISRD